MKKSLLFLLPAAALLLAGCGGETPVDPTSDEPTSSTTSPSSPTSAGPYTPAHAGTEADPLDAADAYYLASELEESDKDNRHPSAEKYYIKGVVTYLKECSASYGNATFTIGGEETPFVGYRLKIGESKTSVPSDDYIGVGDTVVMYSDLLLFGTTRETNDGYIVSNAPVARGVSIDAPEQTEVIGGAIVELVGHVTPAGAPGTLTWTSEKTDVATVDANGRVTTLAVAENTKVKITASLEGTDFSASVELTVKPVPAHPVTSITLDPASVTLDFNTSDLPFERDITATVLPEDADDKAVVWSSTNPAVIKVDQTGHAIPLAAGTAKVVATAHDGTGVKGETTFTLTDSGAPTINGLPETSATVKLGLYQRSLGKYLFWTGAIASGFMTGSQYYEDAADVVITRKTATTCTIQLASNSKYLETFNSSNKPRYRLSDSEIVFTYDAEHNSYLQTITINDAEKTYFVGTYGTFTTFSPSESSYGYTNNFQAQSMTIPTSAPRLNSLVPSFDSLEMPVQDNFKQLEIETNPTYVTRPTIVFESSDETVVTVASDGKLSGKANGNAVVTAFADTNSNGTKDEGEKFVDVAITVDSLLRVSEAKYTGTTTTNMTGNNDRALLNVSDENLNIFSTKVEGQTVHVGLNKDKTMRLYKNESVAINIEVTGGTLRKLIIVTGGTFGTLKVNGEEVEGAAASTTSTVDVSGTSAVITNGHSSNQTYIASITIIYRANAS